METDKNMDKEKTEGEINILDYLIVIAKRKRLIITITLSMAIITAIISLIMTPIYRAKTIILPPSQSSSFIASQLLSRLGGAAGLASSALGIQSLNQVYVGMIQSRTIYDRIIDRFKLMEFYDAEYREDARKRLARSVDVEYDDVTCLLTIAVENQDPKTAADMTNAFVKELKNLLKDIAVTEASQRRLFFDEQLKQTTENLVKSEEAMKEFQEKTGILNPGPLMPAMRIPAVATEYIRKLRDLKYNEKLFEIMAEQYEMAKIDEAKDPSIIQVVDRAIPPEKRAKPKRTIMVLIATFMGFFLSLAIVFLKEYLEKQSGGEDKERIETLKKYLSFKRKK